MDKAADGFVQRPVDVECCLDISLKIMQHLQKMDERARTGSLDIDEKTEVEEDEVAVRRKKDDEEVDKIIEITFIVMISLLSCTDRGIRNKVLKSYIPAFFSWEAKRARLVGIFDGKEVNRREVWCKV